MSLLFNTVLTLHISAGTAGLLTGMLNVIRKKGDYYHRVTGRIFFISMLTAGFSSLILATLNPNFFLFMTGIFTLYMVASGELCLKRPDDIAAMRIQNVVTTLMFLAGCAFIVTGAVLLIQTDVFGLVPVTFGCVGLLFVMQDRKNHKQLSDIRARQIVAHLQRMTGAFIAASTAFLVVNAKYFPGNIHGVVFWLLPTCLLTPLITLWSIRYSVKPNRKQN